MTSLGHRSREVRRKEGEPSFTVVVGLIVGGGAAVEEEGADLLSLTSAAFAAASDVFSQKARLRKVLLPGRCSLERRGLIYKRTDG